MEHLAPMPKTDWDSIPHAASVLCYQGNAYKMLPYFAEHAIEHIRRALSEKNLKLGQSICIAFEEPIAATYLADRNSALPDVESNQYRNFQEELRSLAHRLLDELKVRLKDKGYAQEWAKVQFNDQAYRSERKCSLIFSLSFAPSY